MYEKGKQMNKQYNALGRNLIMFAMLSVRSENGELVYAQAHPVSRCRGNLSSRRMLPISRGLHYCASSERYKWEVSSIDALLGFDARHLMAERKLGIIFRSIDRSHYKTP